MVHVSFYHTVTAEMRTNRLKTAELIIVFLAHFLK